MGQIPVCAFPWNWISYYLILTLGLLNSHIFEMYDSMEPINVRYYHGAEIM